MKERNLTDEKTINSVNDAQEQNQLELTAEEKKKLENVDIQVKAYVEQQKSTEKRDRRYFEFICDNLQEQIKRCEDSDEKAALEKKLADLTELGNDIYTRNQVWRECYELYVAKLSHSEGGEIEYMQCGSKGDSFKYSDEDIAKIGEIVGAYMDKYYHPEIVSAIIIRHINEKGFHKDSEIYKSINMSKALWHNIVNASKEHRPQKNNLIRIAIALRLNLEETEHLLKSAGYAFDYTAFDSALKSLFESGMYQYAAIQEFLYSYFGRCLEKEYVSKERSDKKEHSDKDEKF